MDKSAGIDHTSHRTKIVATVGPACDTYEKLLDLVKAGVNVFRLNFSHGSYEDKKIIIDFIREINRKEPYNIAILGDLQGPKLRVGDLENGQIELKDGSEFIFTTQKIVGTKEKIYGVRMPVVNEFDHIRIPLGHIEEKLAFKENDTIILFCQSSIFSKNEKAGNMFFQIIQKLTIRLKQAKTFSMLLVCSLTSGISI